MVVHSHRDLVVWQRAMDLVVSVYLLTEHYPRSEMYGLTSQTRRAAVSIPANIAEGRSRGTRADFRQFLLVAYSSGAELDTHLDIARRLPFSKALDFSRADQLVLETRKMLNTMIRSLKS